MITVVRNPGRARLVLRLYLARGRPENMQVASAWLASFGLRPILMIDGKPIIFDSDAGTITTTYLVPVDAAAEHPTAQTDPDRPDSVLTQEVTIIWHGPLPTVPDTLTTA